MSNAVTEATPIGTILIPEAEERAILELDRTLTTFRRALMDPNLPDIRRMTLQAKAILAIQDLITPAMMKDFKALMNSPLGFKTDRPPGAKGRDQKPLEEYSETVIKRCVIVALLAGAKLTGDEFNIIASQCYLAKKFYQHALFAFPGFSNLEVKIGVPVRYGERAAAVEAEARWKVNGTQYSVECKKGDAAKGEMDSRIVVVANEGMGPDAILGKAEKKLLAKIHARLTGMNTDPDEITSEAADDPVTINSTATRNETPVEKTAEQTKAESDKHAADKIYLEFVASIESDLEMTAVKEKAAARRKLVETSEWSKELKNWAIENINAAVKSRCEAIRDNRGQNSNKKKDQAELPMG